jgi:hypothetical protein
MCIRDTEASLVGSIVASGCEGDDAVREVLEGIWICDSTFR